MTLVRRLADHMLQAHPDRATAVLERLGPEPALATLQRGSVAGAGRLLRRLSPQTAEHVLSGLEPTRAANVLAGLEVDTAARLLRRLDPPGQEALLERMEARRARSARALLGFPEGTAGALMDPDVLALPQELSAREALARVRSAAEQTRYNLYVVNPEQRLVGVLNLRELLLARGRSPLSDLMVRDPHRILASAGRAEVLAHPGWLEVHSLPVVDASDAYLGAIRYRTLREIEEEAHAPGPAQTDTAEALGQIFAVGAGGLLDALGGARTGGGSHGA